LRFDFALIEAAIFQIVKLCIRSRVEQRVQYLFCFGLELHGISAGKVLAMKALRTFMKSVPQLNPKLGRRIKSALRRTIPRESVLSFGHQIDPTNGAGTDFENTGLGGFSNKSPSDSGTAPNARIAMSNSSDSQIAWGLIACFDRFSTATLAGRAAARILSRTNRIKIGRRHHHNLAGWKVQIHADNLVLRVEQNSQPRPSAPTMRPYSFDGSTESSTEMMARGVQHGL